MESKQRRPNLLMAAYMATINPLLPGDHIHHVAPINRARGITQAGIDAKDAAEAKRQRKLARNVRLAEALREVMR